MTRLSLAAVGDLLHVDYYGTAWDEPFSELLSAVVSKDVSAVIASLNLRGPDEGANGTRNWDVSLLGDGKAKFPSLRALSIERTRPKDHNRSIVAETYDEDGVLARILKQSPSLEYLVSPSAPNGAFFEVGERPLRFLSIDTGYDRQDFIRNLARSTCFPHLLCLEFGEFNEKYLDDYAAQCTPLADYQELFNSDVFKSLRRFVWRNPVCPAAKIRQLRALCPWLQVEVVRT
ncbi:MAG: hypothetical protein ACKVP0_23985 [Pirellulaceae bacterium]